MFFFLSFQILRKPSFQCAKITVSNFRLSKFIISKMLLITNLVAFFLYIADEILEFYLECSRINGHLNFFLNQFETNFHRNWRLLLILKSDFAKFKTKFGATIPFRSRNARSIINRNKLTTPCNCIQTIQIELNLSHIVI